MPKHEHRKLLLSELEFDILESLYASDGFMLSIIDYVDDFLADDDAVNHLLSAFKVGEWVNVKKSLMDILLPLCCNAIIEAQYHWVNSKAEDGFRASRVIPGWDQAFENLHQWLASYPQLDSQRILQNVSQLNALMEYFLGSSDENIAQTSRIYFVKLSERLKGRGDLKTMLNFFNRFFHEVLLHRYRAQTYFKDRLDNALASNLSEEWYMPVYERVSPIVDLEQLKWLSQRLTDSRKKPQADERWSPVEVISAVTSLESFDSYIDLESLSQATVDLASPPKPSKFLQRAEQRSVRALEKENQKLLAELERMKAESVAQATGLPPVREVVPPTDAVNISIDDLLDLYRLADDFVPIASFDASGRFILADARLKNILAALDPQKTIPYQAIKADDVKVVSYLAELNGHLIRFAMNNSKMLFIGKLKKAFDEWQKYYATQIETLNPSKKLFAKAKAVTAESEQEVLEQHTIAEKRTNVQALLGLYLEADFLTEHLTKENQKTVADKESFLDPDALEHYATQANGSSPPMIQWHESGRFQLDSQRLFGYIDKLSVTGSIKSQFKTKIADYQARLLQDGNIHAFLDDVGRALRKVLPVYLNNIDVETNFWVAMRGARSAWQTKHGEVLASYQAALPKPVKIIEKPQSNRPALKPFLTELVQQPAVLQSMPLRRASSAVNQSVVASDNQIFLPIKKLYRSFEVSVSGGFVIDESVLTASLKVLNPSQEMGAVITAIMAATTSIDQMLSIQQALSEAIKSHAQKAALQGCLTAEHASWTRLHRAPLVVYSLCRFNADGDFIGAMSPADLEPIAKLLGKQKDYAKILFVDLQQDQAILMKEGVLAFVTQIRARLIVVLQATNRNAEECREVISQFDKAFNAWRVNYTAHGLAPVSSSQHFETSVEKNDCSPHQALQNGRAVRHLQPSTAKATSTVAMIPGDHALSMVESSVACQEPPNPLQEALRKIKHNLQEGAGKYQGLTAVEKHAYEEDRRKML